MRIVSWGHNVYSPMIQQIYTYSVWLYECRLYGLMRVVNNSWREA